MFTTITKIGRRGRRFARFLIGKDLLQHRQLNIPTECHGSEHGSWTVARDTLDRNSIVYSIGVGSEMSFDISLIQQYGLTVHAFDPTPRSIEWIQKQIIPSEFHFYSIGIADFDGVATFHPPANPSHVSYSLMGGLTDGVSQPVQAPVRRLRSLMTELGHSYIDLLKMDIEGSEYGVIENLLDEHIPVRQILVEFHHRFSSGGVEKTRKAIGSLNQAGYRIFFVSDLGEEYSFLQIFGE